MCDVACDGVGVCVWNVVRNGVSGVVCDSVSGVEDGCEVEWLILRCLGVLIYDRPMT